MFLFAFLKCEVGAPCHLHSHHPLLLRSGRQSSQHCCTRSQELPGAGNEHGTQFGVRLLEMRTGKAESEGAQLVTAGLPRQVRILTMGNVSYMHAYDACILGHGAWIMSIWCPAHASDSKAHDLIPAESRPAVRLACTSCSMSSAMQDASISSFLEVRQLSCYWRPAGCGVPDEALPITVDARGPNAVLQPVDCSLGVKMHTVPSGASVIEAASVVQSVDVQLHQQQVKHKMFWCLMHALAFARFSAC